MKCTHLHPGSPTHAASDTVPREQNTVWSGLPTQVRYVAWTAAVSGATGSVHKPTSKKWALLVAKIRKALEDCPETSSDEAEPPERRKQQSSLKLHQEQILTKQLQREQPNRSTTISLMTYTFLYNIPSVV